MSQRDGNFEQSQDRVEERPSQPEPVKPSGGVPWGLALFLVLAVLLVVFAVQNTQDVQLNFLAWTGEFPLVIIIITVFVVSVIIDELIVFITRRRRRRRAEEKAELRRLRSEHGSEH